MSHATSPKVAKRQRKLSKRSARKAEDARLVPSVATMSKRAALKQQQLQVLKRE